MQINCTIRAIVFMLALMPFRQSFGEQQLHASAWIFKSKHLSEPIYVIGTVHGGSPFPSHVWPRVSDLIQSSQGIAIENIVPINSAVKLQMMKPSLFGIEDLSDQARACHAKLLTTATIKPNFGKLPIALQAYLGSSYVLPESKVWVNYSKPVEHGLEFMAMKAAQQASKKISEIETVSSWQSIFNSMTKKEIEDIFLGLCKMSEANASAKLLADSRSRMLKYYLEGDLSAALQSMRQHHEETLGWPNTAFDKFIFGRNLLMAERIKHLSSSNRASVFLVGAAHLYGEQGLIELLHLEAVAH